MSFKEQIQYHQEIQTGMILGANNNGTYEIGFRGNPFPISLVESDLKSSTLKVGDSVVFQFTNQDRNRTRIIGRSSKQAGLLSTTEVAH